jgi:hypothetical protein
LTVALACLCVPGSSSAGDERPLPHRLAVTVEWGRPAGPEAVRSALEYRIVEELAAERCFRSVRVGAPEAPQIDDLALRLVVHAYSEETEFDFGVADSGSPDLATGDRKVARIEADLHAEVRTVAESALVRERRFVQRSSWRPLANDDPREQALRQMIDSVARATRKFACKGSRASWSKQLERARAAPAR